MCEEFCIRYTFGYNGYECSSAGDKRFSAFYARMPDGRSIEEHYQCDIKGYDKGGTNWRLGKGKPPKNEDVDLWSEYLSLWRKWSEIHPIEMVELAIASRKFDCVLSDRFAKTLVNQAAALATILNEWIDSGKLK